MQLPTPSSPRPPHLDRRIPTLCSAGPARPGHQRAVRGLLPRHPAAHLGGPLHRQDRGRRQHQVGGPVDQAGSRARLLAPLPARQVSGGIPLARRAGRIGCSYVLKFRDAGSSPSPFCYPACDSGPWLSLVFKNCKRTRFDSTCFSQHTGSVRMGRACAGWRVHGRVGTRCVCRVCATLQPTACRQTGREGGVCAKGVGRSQSGTTTGAGGEMQKEGTFELMWVSRGIL